jgi:tRNA(Arg) A34 adenosine deaminase TadA
MRSSPTARDLEFMQRAIDLAAQHMRAGHSGPFGAIITRQDKIIARGWNTVIPAKDPTAHAEINAIREAAAVLGGHQLGGCVLYTSCEPCPMCLGAAWWARLERIVFAAARADAAAIGFDDEEIYAEVARPISGRKLPMQELLRERAVEVLREWQNKPDKTVY